MRRIEAAIAGLALGVFAVGAALVPLELPWFTRLLSARVSQLPDALALPLAEASRRFVIAGDLAARDVLDRMMAADAVSHLGDVHAVIVTANRVTALLALALLAWAVLRARHDRLLAGLALAIGAGTVCALTVLAVGAAALDFDSFFSAFHGLFFATGTWTFPADSVLIRLFPEAFWITAGAVWGGLILCIAVGYATAAWALLRKPKTARAS